ncbi:sialate O-acetylesterase, partial [candidate division KSB1 bacterium]
FTAFLLFMFSGEVFADVKLPGIIGSNMVLQRDAEVPIWGWAEPNEGITISFNGQRITTVTCNEGRWMVYLSPMPAGGPYNMTISGNNTISLKNILLGEVWAASGQSNMWWTVNRSKDAEKEIPKADYPNIRLFTVPQVVADEPLEDCEGEWVECSPEVIGEFSAVGYYFGRSLYKSMNVPVGIIHTSWGWTKAESWTSREFLMSSYDFEPIFDRYAKAVEVYPQKKKEYDENISEWEKEAEKLRAEGKKVPRKPGHPLGPLGPRHIWSPVKLFNGMIAPVIPYRIKGAIWYQGESNTDRAFQYRSLFPTMIRSWRYHWNQGSFPFLLVQLANFGETTDKPEESDLAELREAQLMTLSVRNTAMASAIDIGASDDIHPKNKQEVGYRLSLAARAIAYGEDIVYSGPIYSSMRIIGDRIHIKFDHIGNGLTINGKELKGFAIAGKDREFVWAKAEIKDDKVIVWSQEVPNPISVRYGWGKNPVCNLYNEEGLPASPFRTDNWPGVTRDAK